MANIVWLNGKLMPSDEARIDPADRGFTLGDGVFETIRVSDGVPLHWARHFARLLDGAGVLGIALPYSETALTMALHDVVRASGLAAAAVRLTLSRGPAPRGVLPPADTRPTLLMAAGALPDPLPAARMMIARSVRRNEFSPLSRIKSLNYLDSVLARREAAAAGADDALLLNTLGHLAEATAANVFLFIDGRWVTPRIEDGALPGIARSLLLDRGRAVESYIPQETLASAEAGVLVNSLGRRILQAIGNAPLNQAHPALEVLLREPS